MIIDVVRSVRAWESLRTDWDTLLERSVFPSVFLSFDYLWHAYQSFHAGDSEPFILTVRKPGGELAGILPLRRSSYRRAGVSFAVLEYLVSWEIDKPYLIASSEYEEAAWRAVARFLEEHPDDWDLLKLVEVPDSTAGVACITSVLGGPGYRVRTETGPDSPVIDLRQNWDAFLAGHRRYRKALHRFERQQPGSEVTCFDNTEGLVTGIERYKALERLSWKSGKLGLQKNAWHRAFYDSVLPAMARQGRLSVHLLVSAGGQDMSGLLCLRFGSTVYPHHTAYNPTFADCSPGKLLIGLVFRHYMSEPDFERADMLCGFADYYKPWSSTVTSTTQLSVLRLSLRMRLALGLRGALNRLGAGRQPVL